MVIYTPAPWLQLQPQLEPQPQPNPEPELSLSLFALRRQLTQLLQLHGGAESAQSDAALDEADSGLSRTRLSWRVKGCSGEGVARAP